MKSIKGLHARSISSSGLLILHCIHPWVLSCSKWSFWICAWLNKTRQPSKCLMWIIPCLRLGCQLIYIPLGGAKEKDKEEERNRYHATLEALRVRHLESDWSTSSLFRDWFIDLVFIKAAACNDDLFHVKAIRRAFRQVMMSIWIQTGRAWIRWDALYHTDNLLDCH